MVLTAVLTAGSAFCQEEIKSPHIQTMVGKVVKMDLESGVVSVATGTVFEQAFLDAHVSADLWGELIKNGYIDPSGTIQAPFYALDTFSQLLLSKKYAPQKKLIFNIFQKALIDHGIMMFYIYTDSDLLQDEHHIASLEIEQGDPVTIQYNSSPDKNTVVRLVNNRPADF
jgi:hypothetical protein